MSDYPVQVLESFNPVNIKLNNKDLLIIALLEYICTTCGKPDHLFWTICEYLVENGIITDKKILEMSDVRHLSQQLIHTLLDQATSPMLTSSSTSICNTERKSLTSICNTDRNFYESRYLTDFIELEKIGRGGYGTVYRAYNKLDTLMYAIKKIKIKNLADEKNNYYLNEVKYLSKLSHPNIVRYYSTWIEFHGTQCKKIKPCLFIQMELCTGSLEQYLLERNYSGQITFDLNIKKFIDSYGIIYTFATESSIFSQLLKALRYIHKQGIIHGDINPSNIFLDQKLRVKIGDFGLSKTYTDNHPINTNSYGNIMYMSPEQRNLRICSVKSDIYSLGIVLLELFLPFKTMMEKMIVIDSMKNKNYSLFNNLNPQLKDLLLGMVNPDQSTRFKLSKIKKLWKSINP